MKKILLSLCLGLMAILSFAATPAVELKAFTPAQVRPNAVSEYVLVLKNMSPKIRLDSIPIPDGLKYIGSSQSNQTSIINGAVSQQTELILSFSAPLEGTYTIAPWSFDFDGKSYSVGQATLSVDKNAPENVSRSSASAMSSMGFGGMPSIAQMMSGFGSRRGQSAASAQRAAENAKISLDGKISLELKLPREKLYVGETVPVELVFSFDKSLLAQRIVPRQIIPQIKNLNEFNCPGFKTEPSVEKDLDPEKVSITYTTALTPLKVGRYNLDFEVQGVFTREISIDDMMDMSFFERMDLGAGVSLPFAKTLDDKNVEILPLPAEGKPEDFSGAIGNFTILSAKIDPTSTSVGDPCTMIVQITGVGNFDRINPPALANNPKWKFYTPKTSSFVDESKDLAYIGTKTFEYVVVPNSPDIADAPTFQMSFFDPTKQKYQTLKSENMALKVSPRNKSSSYVTATQSAQAGTDAANTPKNQVGDIMQSEGKSDSAETDWLAESPEFIFIQLAILCLFAILVGVKINSNRLDSDPVYARKVRAKKALKTSMKAAACAVQNNNPNAFFVNARSALQAVLSGFSEYEPRAITLREALEILSQKNVPDAEKESLTIYFEGADALAFGNFETKNMDLNALLDGLKKLTEALQK